MPGFEIVETGTGDGWQIPALTQSRKAAYMKTVNACPSGEPLSNSVLSSQL
jgi:hypothetical protein